MESVIGRARGLGLLVNVSLSGQAVFALDATTADPVLVAPTKDATLSINISPRHLMQLLSGEMEPRTAIQYGYMQVEGSPQTAIRLGDALSGSVDDRYPADHNRLPQPTTDIDLAKQQFEEFGYCIIRDAISPSAMAALRSRLIEQAEVEKALGLAMLDGGAGTPNQRPWNLVNKGVEFESLLENHLIQEFGNTYLGEGFILGGLSGNIAGPGGEPQTLHYDQMVHQPSVPFMSGFNIAWLLDDVTEENGGTRIIPGSHRWHRGPDNPYSIEGTIAAEGPAGSVVVWDTRLWHGTGPNRTNKKRHVLLSVFYRYFFRANENYSLVLSPEVEARASDEVKSLLGFRITGRLGTVETVREGIIVARPEQPVGPLYRKDVRI
jgi:hypothetical protein